MNGNGERSPGAIQAEIERRRADLDRTLSAIEQRLTPGQLVDQGMEYLRASGGPEFASRLGEQAKANPMPVVLVGIGLAWLMMGGRGNGASAQQGSVVASTQRAAASVREGGSQATQRVAQVAQSARETTAQVADSARRTAQQVKSGYRYLLEEQPLALGAAALAIGALLGAWAPRTREEDQLMGEAKERVKDEVAATLREPAERAKDAAVAAGEAAVSQAAARR